MLNRFKKFASEQKDGFCSYEWSKRVVQRGKQTFAVFGSTAYDVSKIKFTSDCSPECNPGNGSLCVPIKGRYLAEFPDEGRDGIMGCYIIPDRRGDKGKNKLTSPSFVSCGWLYTEELELSKAEILNNIIEDVEAGENVFTTKPAGWV